MPSDAEILALCGWMEDRSEGVGFCYNVMHVIVNRVDSPDFPNTVHDVVYQKNAFSWTRPSDPQYGKVPKPGDAMYEACLYAAPHVLGRDSDPTGGALYYANLKTMDKGGWFERNIVNKPDKHPMTIKIGMHTFYA